MIKEIIKERRFNSIEKLNEWLSKNHVDIINIETVQVEEFLTTFDGDALGYIDVEKKVLYYKN